MNDELTDLRSIIIPKFETRNKVLTNPIKSMKGKCIYKGLVEEVKKIFRNDPQINETIT